MAFVCSTGAGRPHPTCHPLICLLFLFLLGSFSLSAATLVPPTAPAAPAARRISPQVVRAGATQTLVVSGAFSETDLQYSVRPTDGSPLPQWIVVDATTGSLTITPPTAAVGQLLQLAVSAGGVETLAASTEFYLLVDYHRFVCQLDANTDRLGRILDCSTGTVQLRGFTSTGTYEWSGPNGFTSQEAEPVVSTPGLYQLTTTPADGSSCPRRAIVEVRNHRDDCTTANNALPLAHIEASQTAGYTNDVILLNAANSTDADGQLLTYHWSWDGGMATGPKLDYQFPEGTHEVILTVMDNTGAKSTDRISIRIDEIPLVSEFWMEAECATIGDNWEVVESAAAAGGSYVSSPLSSGATTVPADAPQNHVRFALSTERGGTYHLMARVAAATNQHDSYWVRVNNGSWYKWNNGFQLNAGFRWVRMPLAVNLTAGSNLIDFAYREPDTRLDKLLVSVADELPTGMGLAMAGCVPNEPPVARASADSYLGVAPHQLTLDATASTDPNDNIARYQWAWTGGSAEGVVTTATLPQGNYEITLTVTDDMGAYAKDVIAVQVDPAPPSPENGPVFWLEAECASVGSRWVTQTTLAASGGKYVVVRNGNALESPPRDLADNRVRFVFASPAANQYELFARIDAPSNLDDSYYVRVNDGAWLKWNAGIKQSEGFRWNKLPEGVTLREGTNTVDFAFREDGTRLDKIMLAPVKNQAHPSGTGPAAANCGTPADVWLEAECATASGSWKEATDRDASGGAGVYFSGTRNMSPPAAGSEADRLSFTFSTQQAAVYNLFMRLDAPDRGSNSVWVRIDGGDWMQFWQEVGGAELLTQGYEWRKVNHSGDDRSFALDAGSHTITIAHRETGTRIDKLYLTPALTAPAGMGSPGSNCDTPPTSQTMMTLGFATTEEAPTDEQPTRDISVYPNPVTTALTLELHDAYHGEVEVRILDATGRQVRHLSFHKERDHLNRRITTEQLPAGMYRLLITEGEQLSNEAFVKD